MSRLFGLFADLSHRRVVVVGGGSVAERKVSALLEANAQVVVGAPDLTPQLQAWVNDAHITHIAAHYQASWLDESWLVVAATDDNALNQRVAEDAETRHMFVNVVDDARLSTFHTPAIVDRGLLQIAISTAGAAPGLARHWRARIETVLDESSGALTTLAARCRSQIKKAIPTFAARRAFYDRLLAGPVTRYLRAGQPQAAEQALLEQLQTPHAAPAGHVTLVGAGPGAAGLLTLDGLRALQQADIILHDRLVSADVVALARRDAERIEVGKSRGHHRFTQAQINHLLVRYAQAGQHVVRLKGGDPFVFGRGGEELEYLQAHQVGYTVVPGITAASACAAYAGVPLTHRNYAQSVSLVTAHCRQSIDALDWQALAHARQTLVFYMGVSKLAEIEHQLLAHGKAATTPLIVVENASRGEQRSIRGTLGHLATLAEAHRIRSPALLVLGDVAQLHDTLAWFGRDETAVEERLPAATLRAEQA